MSGCAAEQLAYAANDAAVLLAIFDALVAVAPPASFPVVRGLSFPDDRAHQESDTTVAAPPHAPHAQAASSEAGGALLAPAHATQCNMCTLSMVAICGV